MRKTKDPLPPAPPLIAGETTVDYARRYATEAVTTILRERDLAIAARDHYLHELQSWRIDAASSRNLGELPWFSTLTPAQRAELEIWRVQYGGASVEAQCAALAIEDHRKDRLIAELNREIAELRRRLDDDLK